eukprot:jgi/Psemu1/219505/e_gw1.979.4.1
MDCTNDGSFRLDGKKNRDCNWVAKKNTRRRCQQTDRASKLRVKFFCPLFCKEKCKRLHQSSAPSPLPLHPSCPPNNPDFRFNGHPRKDCAWAAKQPEKRCGLEVEEENHENTIDGGISKSKKKVREWCPSACDLSCVCKNSKKPFELEHDDAGTALGCKTIKTKAQCNHNATTIGNSNSNSNSSSNNGKSKGKKLVADFCPKKCGTCLSNNNNIIV